MRRVGVAFEPSAHRFVAISVLKGGLKINMEDADASLLTRSPDLPGIRDLDPILSEGSDSARIRQGEHRDFCDGWSSTARKLSTR